MPDFEDVMPVAREYSCQLRTLLKERIKNYEMNCYLVPNEYLEHKQKVECLDLRIVAGMDDNPLEQIITPDQEATEEAQIISVVNSIHDELRSRYPLQGIVIRYEFKFGFKRWVTPTL